LVITVAFRALAGS